MGKLLSLTVHNPFFSDEISLFDFDISDDISRSDISSEKAVIRITSVFCCFLRKCLKELDISDPTRRLKFDPKENTVAVPIDVTKVNKLSEDKGDNEANCCQHVFDTLEKYLHGNVLSVKRMHLPFAKKLSIKTPEIQLRERLRNLVIDKGFSWCEELVVDIPSHWEKHGDLVLVPPSSFTSSTWTELGDAFWDCVTSCLSCKRVARKDIVSTDGFRTPQVNMLYGESSWVQHTDNGIKYTYDITKCMFSSGNITEKLRVAKFDCTDEVVVDLYAGIGYFTLPYLVYTKVKHLHACEWNPDAVEALHQNLILNGVQDRCTVHKGDNRRVCPQGVADRVNLGLIPSSREGWPVACTALNPRGGGILHIHHNVNTRPELYNKPLQVSQPPIDVFRCEAKLVPKGRPGLGDELSESVTNESGLGSPFKSTRESHSINISPCNVGSVDEKKCDTVSQCEGDLNDTKGQSMVEDKTKCIKDDETRLFSDSESSSYKTASSQNTLDEKVSTNNHSETKVDKVQTSTFQDLSKSSKWLPWAQEVSKEIKEMLEELHKNDWTTTILHIEHVKSYAPYIDHVVLDLECRPVLNKPIP